MLKLGADAFTQGFSRFSDRRPGVSEPTAKIFVKVRFTTLDFPTLAQLDTGCAWSILDPETAALIGASGKDFGEPIRLSTRLGTREGPLVKVPLTLVADEGEPLEVEGTFFVPADWPAGEVFLGYSGLLDSLRLALDPGFNRFYFGPLAGRS
jgi:hypothetical protein